MTKEEFYKLAERDFEIPEKSIYCLEIREFRSDIRAYRKMPNKNEWYFSTFTTERYFSNYDSAVESLRKYIAEEKQSIHSALLQRLRIDTDINNYTLLEWWLFDAEGNQVDRSHCSSCLCDDPNRPEGVFFGCKPEDIRFKEGDIVEVRYFNDKIWLGIINGIPTTIEEEWQHYCRKVKNWGPLNEDIHGKFGNGYFADAIYERYFILGFDGFDPDVSPSQVYKPTFEVPQKAKDILLPAYERWKANVDDVVAGKITWSELGAIVRGEKLT